jgi:hypothetical protein
MTKVIEFRSVEQMEAMEHHKWMRQRALEFTKALKHEGSVDGMFLIYWREDGSAEVVLETGDRIPVRLIPEYIKQVLGAFLNMADAETAFEAFFADD